MSVLLICVFAIIESFFNVAPEEALAIFKEVALLLDDAEVDEVYKSSMFNDGDDLVNKSRKTASSKTPPRAEIKKWMIPANPKYFDIASCLSKHGSVYWRQHFNFQTGDIIYIYITNPESAVRYKCVVEGHDLPYSSYNDIDLEFYVNPQDYEDSKSHNRFMKLKLLSKSNSDRLKMVHLLENGMNKAPQGCLNLSYKGFAELLNYIETIF